MTHFGEVLMPPLFSGRFFRHSEYVLLRQLVVVCPVVAALPILPFAIGDKRCWIFGSSIAHLTLLRLGDKRCC